MARKNVLKEIPEIVRTGIRQTGMLKGVKKAVIAFSAGPDSVCLLDIMDRLYRGRVCFKLAYVNHGLRPKKILAQEEDLVKYYSRRFGVEYAIHRIKITKSKLGWEGQARLQRQQVLIEEMNRCSAQCVILAHNRDDWAETLIMNLIRGSSSRGFGSFTVIAPPFIRPLVSVEKKQILAYLQRRGLKYSHDRSNDDCRFRRNLVRHKIMPLLRAVNPKILDALERTARLIQQDDDCLSMQAECIFRRAVRIASNRMLLDIPRLMRYNKALIARVVRRALMAMVGTLEGWENQHFMAIIDLMKKEPGKTVHLPDGLVARKDYDCVIISTRVSLRDFVLPLPLNGQCRLPDGSLVRTRIFDQPIRPNPGQEIEVFDRDAIFPPLLVRKRRAGDFLQTGQGKKKLKKFCTEYRIPFEKRPELMVLADQRGVLCLLGYARARRAFITDKTTRYLQVAYEKTDQ